MMNELWITVDHPKEKDFIAFIKKAYKQGRKRPNGIFQSNYENKIIDFLKLSDMFKSGELITKPKPTFYQKLRHKSLKIINKIKKT